MEKVQSMDTSIRANIDPPIHRLTSRSESHDGHAAYPRRSRQQDTLAGREAFRSVRHRPRAHTPTSTGVPRET